MAVQLRANGALELENGADLSTNAKTDALRMAEGSMGQDRPVNVLNEMLDGVRRAAAVGGAGGKPGGGLQAGGGAAAGSGSSKAGAVALAAEVFGGASSAAVSDKDMELAQKLARQLAGASP